MVTDDIVTRLRVDREDTTEDWWLLQPVFSEAAAEIERLRAEVNLWMGVAERFAESHPQYEAFRYYFKARTK